MSKEDHYFQFPLSALAYDLATKWVDIIAYVGLDYGRKKVAAISDVQALDILSSYEARNPRLKRANHNADTRALVVGFAELGIVVKGDAVERVRAAHDVETFCSQFCGQLVRIRSDLWWKTFDPKSREESISLREFRVLCAAYSGIGAKPYTKLSLEHLQRMAAGYARRSEFDKANLNSKLTVDGRLLSVSQMRTTLDALRINRFFSKFTYRRGECFYSHKMSEDQLKSAVKAKKLRKLEARAKHKLSDEGGSQDIQSAKANLKSGILAEWFQRPKGWPDSEEAARALAVSMGEKPDVVAHIWGIHEEQGFRSKDANGNWISISDFKAYVKQAGDDVRERQRIENMKKSNLGK